MTEVSPRTVGQHLSQLEGGGEWEWEVRINNPSFPSLPSSPQGKGVCVMGPQKPASWGPGQRQERQRIKNRQQGHQENNPYTPSLAPYFNQTYELTVF